jgi:hypothetical protein
MCDSRKGISGEPPQHAHWQSVVADWPIHEGLLALLASWQRVVEQSYNLVSLPRADSSCLDRHVSESMVRQILQCAVSWNMAAREPVEVTSVAPGEDQIFTLVAEVSVLGEIPLSR